MKKVIDWLKSQRLGKVITVFLSGLLLFVSTACGGGNVLAKTADQVREEVPQGAVTSTYKGGMNDYSDVDPRRDATGAGAKAKALVDNAERNVIDQTSDVGENTNRILDKKGENAKHVGENLQKSDVKEKAHKSAEDFAEGTKRGIENIKGNTQDALGGTKGAVDDAGDAVKSKVKSDVKTTKETLEDAGSAVQSKVKSDIHTTKRALDKAEDAVD
jgi:ElaB/YqjD/DUF883 family membrane-anchored ribosome-binding protein